MQAPTAIRQQLRADIEACGYFPNLVEDGVLLAASDEPINSFLVHHEPTFDRDEIHRHLTVVLLTPSRLIVGHTDDHHQPGDAGEGTYASSSTESISLRKVSTVVLTRVVPQPETYQPGESEVEETWLTIGWGAMRRIDIEPAVCGDPRCEADHGYTGAMAADDLTIRMSRAADGADQVNRLVRFATELQRVTGQ